MKKSIKSTIMVMFLVMLALLVAACSSNNTNSTNNTNSNNTNNNSSTSPGTNTNTETEAPAELETVRVSIWERGNAPQGQVITDTVMSRWINEQVADLGIKIEFVPLPRSEEEARLNTWMASGTAPDLIITYSYDVFHRYASQGGLAPLDDALAEYGQEVMERNAKAMETGLGTYEGVRYALMAERAATTGANMNIRQDWLDALDMDMPTNIEELYQVLKAFKEQDPGNVGNVVPMGLSSFTSSQTSFLFGTAYGHGVDNYGVGGYLIYPSGNIIDGEFVPDFKTPNAREHFRWLNKLYKEGLISPEFVTDLNGQQLNEDIYAGRVGFIDTNWGPATWYWELKDGVPGVDYVNVPPLIREDGTSFTHRDGWHGMFLMVPKTSEANAHNVIKYLNWQSDPDVLIALNGGFEGEHYNIVDGARLAIDPKKNADDFGWYATDLAIVRQGLPRYDDETLRSLLTQSHDEIFAEKNIEFNKYHDKYNAVSLPFPQYDRPFVNEITPALADTMKEEASKVIIAADFDAAYDALLARWDQLDPNGQYAAEITAGLKEMGIIE